MGDRELSLDHATENPEADVALGPELHGPDRFFGPGVCPEYTSEMQMEHLQDGEGLFGPMMDLARLGGLRPSSIGEPRQPP